MKRSFYIYLNSRNSKDLFPHNFNGEQCIQLAEPIHLEGNWSCGLIEFALSGTPQEPVYVCCDLIRESTTGQFTLPVLRQVNAKTTEVKQVLYVPVKKLDFQTIRVFVKTLHNRDLPRGPGDSSCTLHFRYDDDDV